MKKITRSLSLFRIWFLAFHSRAKSLPKTYLTLYISKTYGTRNQRFQLYVDTYKLTEFGCSSCRSLGVIRYSIRDRSHLQTGSGHGPFDFTSVLELELDDLHMWSNFRSLATFVSEIFIVGHRVPNPITETPELAVFEQTWKRTSSILCESITFFYLEQFFVPFIPTNVSNDKRRKVIQSLVYGRL